MLSSFVVSSKYFVVSAISPPKWQQMLNVVAPNLPAEGSAWSD
jgi:hypothetical protein